MLHNIKFKTNLLQFTKGKSFIFKYLKYPAKQLHYQYLQEKETFTDLNLGLIALVGVSIPIVVEIGKL